MSSTNGFHPLHARQERKIPSKTNNCQPLRTLSSLYNNNRLSLSTNRSKNLEPHPPSRAPPPNLRTHYGRSSVPPRACASPTAPPQSGSMVCREPNSSQQGSGYHTNENRPHGTYPIANRPLIADPIDLEKWEPTEHGSEEGHFIVKTCIEVVDAVVSLDDYFDRAKLLNASNIVELKKKRANKQALTEYDEHIRICIANAGKFDGTWNLLNMLFGAQQLDDYVLKMALTRSDLLPYKIPNALFEEIALEISENSDRSSSRESTEI